MRKKILFTLTVFYLSVSSLLSQSVGVNNPSPHSSAILDVHSTDKGILIPRMNSNQRMNINMPATGLLVFDTDTETFWYRESGGWVELVSGAFKNVGGLVQNRGNNDTDDFIFGSDQLPTVFTTLDTLFLFNKSKGAFRSGTIDSSIWAEALLGKASFASGHNVAAIGDYSFASGHTSIANGDYSFSFGKNNKASGVYTLVGGRDNEAFGNFSISLGLENISQGNNSTTIGYNCLTQGNLSVAIGSSNYTNGLESTAIGRNNSALGFGSMALGAFTTSSGEGAISFGYTTTASGNYSTSLGYQTDAESYASMALGRFNVGGGTQNSWFSLDPLFEIGIGVSDMTRENAMTVLKNGTVSFKDYTFPNMDGSMDQVLKTDGSGQLSWANELGAFEKVGGVVRNVGNPNLDDFVFASDQLPMAGNTDDTLFFFDQSQAAFRSGRVLQNNTWQPSLIGFGSFAAGNGSRASGEFSTSFGNTNSAFGDNSVALGILTEATGNSSLSAGGLTDAVGDFSTSLGYESRAGSYAGFAIGRYNEAGGSTDTWVNGDPLFEVGIGTSLSNRENAMTILKDGTISFKEYVFPNTDGSTDQVLKTDGSGQLLWENDESVFENVNGVVRNTGNDATDDFVFGADQLPTSGMGEGTIFFWDKSKGAMRTGNSDASSWYSSEIGLYSFASGTNTKASGWYSAAFGINSEATDQGSFASGSGTHAIGLHSTSFGSNNSSIGRSSFSVGLDCVASGDYSVAMGKGANASGFISFSAGESTTASANNSFAIGDNSGATGNSSMAMGSGSVASGSTSFAGGTGSEAHRSSSFAFGAITDAHGNFSAALNFATRARHNVTALGRYNMGMGSDDTWIESDPLFEIGNGSGEFNLSNAFTVLKNGNTGINTHAPSSDLDIVGEDNTDAITLDNGQTVIRHHFDFISTDRALMNILLDSDNNQGAAKFSIYKDVIASGSNTAGVNFDLNGGNSWVDGTGNFGINTNSPSNPLEVGTGPTNGNGAHVTAGGTWTNGSSREFKEDFNEVDQQDILDKLSKLEILKWNYKDSNEGQHIGPMAEEFYHTFQLGVNPKYISTIDADGVMMAAIQALYNDNQKKQLEIDLLHQDVKVLNEKFNALMKLMKD